MTVQVVPVEIMVLVKMILGILYVRVPLHTKERRVPLVSESFSQAFVSGCSSFIKRNNQI